MLVITGIMALVLELRDLWVITFLFRFTFLTNNKTFYGFPEINLNIPGTGEKMELNGTEWLCPTCRKEKSAKERESKLKSATRSTVNRASGKQSIQNMYGLNYSHIHLNVLWNSVVKIFVRLLFLCFIFC